MENTTAETMLGDIQYAAALMACVRVNLSAQYIFEKEGKIGQLVRSKEEHITMGTMGLVGGYALNIGLAATPQSSFDAKFVNYVLLGEYPIDKGYYEH